jgi:hypothetical protein
MPMITLPNGQQVNMPYNQGGAQYQGLGSGIAGATQTGSNGQQFYNQMQPPQQPPAQPRFFGPSQQEIAERKANSGNLSPEEYRRQFGASNDEQNKIYGEMLQLPGYVQKTPGGNVQPGLQQMSSLQGSFTPGALDANGNPTNGGINPNGMYTGGQQQQPPPQTGAQNTAGTQAQTTATGAPEAAVDPYGNPIAPVAPPPVNYGSAPPIGLAGSEAALRGGLEGSLSALNQGFGAAYRNVGQTYGTDQIEAARRQAASNTRQGVAGYKPFLSAGQDSVQLQAAISGALGPEAQAQAFADMQTSPEQKFIEDRQQRALLAASSAIGGLGGGNVLTALQEQGAGFASQNIADRIARLNQLSTLGINAAQGGGNLLGQDSQLQMQGAMKQADIQGQRAQTMAMLGQNKALTMADLLTGAGRDVAKGRTDAGNAISDAIGNTTTALANLQNQQGAGTADIIGSATDQLANIGINAGEGLALDQQQLMTLLANLATQQGTQLGQASLSRGTTKTDAGGGLMGDLASIGQAAGGIEAIGAALPELAAAASSFSDARLKTNIERMGATAAGTNLYQWDWTDEGKAIAGDQPTYGVIAQEVQKTQPHAVMRGDNGYLMVDYRRVV